VESRNKQLGQGITDELRFWVPSRGTNGTRNPESDRSFSATSSGLTFLVEKSDSSVKLASFVCTHGTPRERCESKLESVEGNEDYNPSDRTSSTTLIGVDSHAAYDPIFIVLEIFPTNGPHKFEVVLPSKPAALLASIDRICGVMWPAPRQRNDAFVPSRIPQQGPAPEISPSQSRTGRGPVSRFRGF
jgi:hypothetical protein